jgi:hypothetical protein
MAFPEWWARIMADIRGIREKGFPARSTVLPARPAPLRPTAGWDGHS